MLFTSLLSFSQNDTIVKFNTNKFMTGGSLLKQDNTIVITKEGIDVTMTNKKQIKELQKYATHDFSKPLRIVDFKAKDVKITSQTDSQITFEGNDIRITYINTKTEVLKTLVLTIEMKDNFTNAIVTMSYLQVD